MRRELFLKTIVFTLQVCCFYTYVKADNTSIDQQRNILCRLRKFQFQHSDSSAYYLQKAYNCYSGNKKDTIYAEIMMLSGTQTALQGNTNLALIYFEKAREIYANQNHKFGLTEAILNIGEVYYNWADFNKALILCKEAYQLATRYNFEIHKVKALNYMGKYYHSKGNFSESLQYYKQGLQLAEEIGDTIGIVALHNKIGKHFKTIGDYPESLEHFLISENLISGKSNKIVLATTFNHLGNIYQEFKDYKKAIQFHRQALKARCEMNYKEGVAKSLKNLGEVLLDINALDSAMVCFEKSNEICDEIGYTKGQIKNIQNQGVIFHQQHIFKDAILKYQESLELSHKIGYVIGEMKALLSLAEVYKSSESFKQALTYAQKGLKIAVKEEVNASIADFNLMLSEIHQNMGNSLEALKFYQNYTVLYKEMINLETNRKIAELQAQYKLSLQNREYEVLKKESRIKELIIKQKDQFIVFAIVFFCLLIALVFIVYGMFLQKKKANVKLTQFNDNITLQNVELERLNTQLKRSKDQQVKLFSIISHELRNPLYWFRNLVQMLSDRLDSLDKEMISKSLNSLNESANNTFHLMDNLLHWSKSQLGNIKFNPEPLNMNQLIQDNIKLVSHFAALKKISIQYQYKSDYIVYADKVMVQTVIRNILSNAIKFTATKGYIKIACLDKDNYLEVMIKDNGMGMKSKTIKGIINLKGTTYIPTTDQETGSGIGLALSKEFITRNGGELFVISKPGNGSQFSFTMPLYKTETPQP